MGRSTLSRTKSTESSSTGSSTLVPSIRSIDINATAKTASSQSLYHRCATLYAVLRRIPSFRLFLEAAAHPGFPSNDYVNLLWTCFAQGFSLIHLHDSASNINVLGQSFDGLSFEKLLDDPKMQQNAVALFSMALPGLNPEWHPFPVSALWNDRSSLDGFVTVLGIVEGLLRLVSRDKFSPGPTSSSPTTSDVDTIPPSPRASQEAYAYAVRRLIESERQYVQDLELLQKYTTYLERELAKRIFPNLNELLNVQRWFLICLEMTAQEPKQSQRWGLAFLNKEKELASTHEDYSANFDRAANIISSEESTLSKVNSILDVQAELPMFMAKPLKRVYSYRGLLETLREAACNTRYDFVEELDRAWVSARQLETRVETAQRRAHNEQTLKNLSAQVTNWASLGIEELGDLLMVDSTNTNEPAGEVHKCLFERAILSFRSIPHSGPSAGSVSLLGVPLIRWFSASSAREKSPVRLVLESRIMIADIVLVTRSVNSKYENKREYSLNILWTRQNDPSSSEIELVFRTDERLSDWRVEIGRLIREIAEDSAETVLESGTPSVASPPLSELNLPSIISEEIPPLAIDDILDDGTDVDQEVVVPSIEARTPSIKSHATYGDEFSYYFRSFLSPRKRRFDVLSVGSLDDDMSGGYYPKSILSSYAQEQSTSPALANISDSEYLKENNISDETMRIHEDESDDEDEVLLDYTQLAAKVSEFDDTLMTLVGVDAAQTLDVMQQVLDNIQLMIEDTMIGNIGSPLQDLYALRQRLRHLMFKLSRESGQLPPRLNITGVSVPRMDRAVCFGGFADIFLGVLGDQKVAIKRLRVQTTEQQRVLHAMFCKEALIWRQLRHPYILPFIGIDTETFRPFLCMVAPWLPHGNALKYMERADPDALDVHRMLLEVALGVEYLHSQDVIHGDIRGSNILIDESGHVRLADFGLTSISDATIGTNTGKGAGSTRWMAPELFEHDGDCQRTTASDVYAYACVCLELYTCSRPFSSIRNDIQVLLMVREGKRPARPSAEECIGRPMPDHVWQLTRMCWDGRPQKRPRISDVVGAMEARQGLL